MAKMIPSDRREFHNSKGEERVFYALRALPEDVTVIHSFRWLHPGSMRVVKGQFPAQGEGDFVIFDRSQGVMVIEVKGGDIWCKAGQWYQRNRKTGKVEFIYPEEQASNTAYRIVEEVKARIPEARALLVCHAVWFPDGAVERSSLPMNCPSEIVFDAEDVARPGPAIGKAFAYWRKALPEFGGISHETAPKVLGALAPTLSMVRSVRQTLDEREEELVQFTREQAGVVDYLDEQVHAAIHGAAGTGKTLVALAKACRLASPNEPVLFLCYNSALKEYLQRNHAQPNVHFATFDGLVRELIGPGGTLEDAEDAFVAHLLEDRDVPYTHVIIDEGQDFESDWLEALSYKFRDGAFYVFYDRHQFIQRGDPKWLDDVSCRLVLTRNCRNTDAVARVAYRAAGIAVAPTLGVSGPKPSIHLIANDAEAIRIASQLLDAAVQKSKLPPREIAVLSLETLPDDSPWRSLRVAGAALQDRPGQGQATLTTVRKFKGLEAALVMIMDADFRKAGDADWRRRLYVACSRARHAVHIFTTTPESDLGDATKAFAGTEKVRPSWRTLARLLGARLHEGEIDDPFKEPGAR